MGTGFLVAVVVGSGIFAQRLSPDDVGLQLLENSIATGAGLVALILAFGSVSGAHFNPVVSLVDRLLGGLSTRETLVYVPAQVVGACLGAVVANLMFELPAVNVSDQVRSSGGLWLGEVVATFGLVMVILGVVRSGRTAVVPFAVGGYIAAAYWFTSSTSFANPAVTVGPHPQRHVHRHRPLFGPGLRRRPGHRRTRGPGPRSLPASPRPRSRTGRSQRGVSVVTDLPSVLFLCVHNAGRSQMALGWFTHLAGDRAMAWQRWLGAGRRGEPGGGRGHAGGRNRHRRIRAASMVRWRSSRPQTSS